MFIIEIDIATRLRLIEIETFVSKMMERLIEIETFVSKMMELRFYTISIISTPVLFLVCERRL